jgi:hypothetical protein
MASRKKTAAKKSKPDAPDGSRPSPIREELEAERKASGGPEPIVEASAEPKAEPPLKRPSHQRELPPPEVGDGDEFIYAVGEDNCGGRLSKLGVRRLYCNEPRFYSFAAQACMPWYEWVEKRNAVVKQMADSVAAGNPYIEELQKLEIPKYSE